MIGAIHGPRYDVIVAPSGDLAAVRDADGALEVVGKRFNAFAAEQWLAADGDGRDPAQARAIPMRPATGSAASPPCRRASRLRSSSTALAFEEDCARAEVVVSALSAPAGCKAKYVFDERRSPRLGAVGLTWSDDKGFASRPTAARSRTGPGRRRPTARARRPDRAPRPWRLDAAPTRPTRRRSQSRQNIPHAHPMAVPKLSGLYIFLWLYLYQQGDIEWRSSFVMPRSRL